MAILDDGNGQVSPPMRALAGTVLSTARPQSSLQWLRDPRVAGLLSRLRRLPGAAEPHAAVAGHSRRPLL